MENNQNQQNLKLVIVDDDATTRGMYADVFKNAGYQVFQAQDGVEGLDLITKEKPDVIFTGIVMPRMDGFSLIEAMRKNVAMANIPVVISSHLGREEDRKRAQVLGVKDFVVRDLTTPNEVLERVSAIFVKGEYYIQFDPYAMDAQKLARDFNFDGDFRCGSSDERMVFRMELDDPRTLTFKVKLTCPNE